LVQQFRNLIEGEEKRQWLRGALTSCEKKKSGRNVEGGGTQREMVYERSITKKGPGEKGRGEPEDYGLHGGSYPRTALNWGEGAINSWFQLVLEGPGKNRLSGVELKRGQHIKS